MPLTVEADGSSRNSGTSSTTRFAPPTQRRTCSKNPGGAGEILRCARGDVEYRGARLSDSRNARACPSDPVRRVPPVPVDKHSCARPGAEGLWQPSADHRKPFTARSSPNLPVPSSFSGAACSTMSGICPRPGSCPSRGRTLSEDPQEAAFFRPDIDTVPSHQGAPAAGQHRHPSDLNDEKMVVHAPDRSATWIA